MGYLKLAYKDLNFKSFWELSSVCGPNFHLQYLNCRANPIPFLWTHPQWIAGTSPDKRSVRWQTSQQGPCFAAWSWRTFPAVCSDSNLEGSRSPTSDRWTTGLNLASYIFHSIVRSGNLLHFVSFKIFSQPFFSQLQATASSPWCWGLPGIGCPSQANRTSSSNLRVWNPLGSGSALPSLRNLHPSKYDRLSFPTD